MQSHRGPSARSRRIMVVLSGAALTAGLLAPSTLALTTATAKPAAAEQLSPTQTVQQAAGQFYPARGRVSLNQQLAARATATINVVDIAGVPATGVDSVALNIQAKGQSAAGTIAVFPSDATTSTATGLSYQPGYYAANLVTAKVGSNGSIKLKNTGTAPVNFWADIHGYTTSAPATQPGSTYVGLTPARIADQVTIPAYGNFELKPLGRSGVPAKNVQAVAVNLRMESGSSTGTLRVYAAGDAWPADSTIDYPANTEMQNFDIAKIGTDGVVNLHNFGRSPITVWVDVAGFYTTAMTIGQGATTHSVTPTRLTSVTVPAGGQSIVDVLGKAGIPSWGVSQIGVNLTARSTGTGEASVFPSGALNPAVHTVSYKPGIDASGFTNARLGTDGKIILANAGNKPVTVDLDVFSYFLDPVSTAEAHIEGDQLVLRWRQRPEVTEWLLVDDVGQQVVWKGAGGVASLAMQKYQSLVLVAKTTTGTAEATVKFVATGGDPSVGVTPMVVVTTVEGTQLDWGVNGDTTADAPKVDDARVHSADIPDGPAIDIPRSDVAVPTKLGETATVAVITDSAVPEKDPGAATEAGEDLPVVDEPAPEPGPVPEESDVTEEGPITGPGPAEDDGQPPATEHSVEISAPEIDTARIPELASLGLAKTSTLRSASTQTVTANADWHQSWLTYEMYIHQQWAGGWKSGLACDYSWFSGDNRGPALNSGKYRTRVAIKFDWQNRRTTSFKSVNYTNAYEKKNGRYYWKDRRKANISGDHIKITRSAENYSHGWAYSRINHDVHDPFCPSIASVDYTSKNQLWPNGKGEYWGKHDKMPWHEIWREDWRGSNSRTTRIFTHEYNNPDCLVYGRCRGRSYDYLK